MQSAVPEAGAIARVRAPQLNEVPQMKVLKFLLIIVIAAVVIFGWRWYSYVSNTESPYQEVGIELNSRMPGPINKWGCDKLHATFQNVLPPYGCQAATDPKQWR